VKVQSGEWHRAGHLVTDASAVQAYAAVAIPPGFLHQHLNIIHLAPTGEPVHHEENRCLRLGFVLLEDSWSFTRLSEWFCPVQRNMATVLKEDLLTVVVKLELGFRDVIDRLEEWMS